MRFIYKTIIFPEWLQFEFFFAEQVILKFLYISPTQGVLRGCSQWPFALTFLPEDILDGSYAIWILTIDFPKDFYEDWFDVEGGKNPLVIYQEAQAGQELLEGTVDLSETYGSI